MNLPAFGVVNLHREPLAEGVAREAEWSALCAQSAQAAAHLWQAAPGLVVPRRYTLLPGWTAALAAAGSGAVQVRASGGGLVPQGPGVWNLSLIWQSDSAALHASDAVYRALCGELAAALAQLGLLATPGCVDGSFCDGRYNLAVGGRKLVGTAQSWRRIAGKPVVLAHAVIIVNADPAALTEQANRFEAELGSATRYRADALTSVALAAHDPAIAPRTLDVLTKQFTQLKLKENEDGLA